MRSYNGLYWMLNKPEPKRKEKQVKPPKEKKARKPPKIKEKKPQQRPPKKEEWFVVPEPVYPMKIERGNFVLEF